MGPRGWSNVHVSPHRNINLMNSDGRTMYGRAKQDSGLWGSFVSVLSSLLSDNGDVIPSRAADVVSRAVFHDTISDTSQLGRPLGRCSLTPASAWLRGSNFSVNIRFWFSFVGR